MKYTKPFPSAFLFFGLLSCSGCWFYEDGYPTADLPPVYPQAEWIQVERPEDFGWNSEQLAEARKIGERIGSHSSMLVQGGQLIAAWGNTSQRFYVASCRKSLLSILYGKPVGEGVIDLSSTLGDLGLDDITPLTDSEKLATVADLLTTSSGIGLPAAASSEEDVPVRGAQAPGEAWIYNNWDFNALGTLYEEATGQGIFAAFTEQIAEPVGMEDWKEQHGQYQTERVSEHPAYHFRMTTRDMARLGLLMLRQGVWEGDTVVSSDWLQQSTQGYYSVPENSGGGAYGYMWWVHDGTGILETEVGIPSGSFSAQGHWSQLILMVPEWDLVFVHRGYAKNLNPSDLMEFFKAVVAARQP
ncbi:MAG TPA: hypothetical protein DCE41_26165 [Cytophagales bacterium]|nr:hypothetical protein [Cytophagales bacterium]HAA22430.1 hypothetical protein [Cytophagales bacterium]